MWQDSRRRCSYHLAQFASCKTVHPQPSLNDRCMHRPGADRVTVNVVRHITLLLQRRDTYKLCRYPGPHQRIMCQIFALGKTYKAVNMIYKLYIMALLWVLECLIICNTDLLHGQGHADGLSARLGAIQPGYNHVSVIDRHHYQWMEIKGSLNFY